MTQYSKHLLKALADIEINTYTPLYITMHLANFGWTDKGRSGILIISGTFKMSGMLIIIGTLIIRSSILITGSGMLIIMSGILMISAIWN